MADSPRSAWYELGDDGRRHAVPYWHAFSSFAKGRWVGRTVLEVLSDEFPGTDAAYIESSASSGRLTLNGLPAHAETRFTHGDHMVHSVQRFEPSVPSRPITLLLEDEDLLALDKPAGVPVHHAGRYRRNTVVEILQAERPELGLGGSGGLHVLHRLDRQVSGVLLLPRSPAAAAAFSEAMRDGRMRKRYLARVRGKVLASGAALAVTAPIRVTTAAGATTTDCHPSGKHATTVVRSLAYDSASATSLVLCEPITGRSHQLRLHLRHIGHPIRDDPIYDNQAEPVQEPAALPVAPAKRPRQDGSRKLLEGCSADSAGTDAAFACVSDPDELWLHACSYSCANGPRPFCVEAPLPAWCDPFRGALPALSQLDGAHDPVPLESDVGRALLDECDACDRRAFDWLWEHYEPQRSLTLCGPASVGMVLRAAISGGCGGGGGGGGDGGSDDAIRRAAQRLEAISEDGVVDGQSAVAASEVRSAGVTLPELGAMLDSLGIPCKATHARGDLTAAGPCATAAEEAEAMRCGLDSLRDAMRRAPECALLLNYHMSTAGQRPFQGHISPLGAYHARSNRFLVLDVWPQTRPAWLSGDHLWAAMAATDACSGLSRGWVLLAQNAQSATA